MTKSLYFTLLTVLIILCCVGTCVRFAQMFRTSRALCGKPLTEDSYYAFNIARNIAIGNGITYNGKVWTNGFQPAVVFVQSLFYKMADGDKAKGIRFILGFSAVLAVLTAMLSGKLAGNIQQRMFPGLKNTGWVGARLICCALWLGSYSIFIQDMNGLETGLYFFILSVLLLLSIRVGENIIKGITAWSDYVILAVVGTLSMYVRNDAFFFLAPLYISFFILGVKSRVALKTMVALCFSGAGMIFLFSPWMMYNLHIGGSIVPISGPAESVMAKDYAQNTIYMVSAVLDYFFVGLETPISDLWFGFWGPFVIRMAMIISIITFFLWFRKRASLFAASQNQQLYVLFIISSAFAFGWCLLVAYYTHEFFAWWMFRRYFCPVYVLWVPWVSAFLFQLLRFNYAKKIIVALFSAYAVVFSVYMVDLFTTKRVIPMYHFAQFCKNHLPENALVAAWQTGILGYYWDNTINLDGKVNPEIQQYREKGENTYNYIADRLPDVVIEFWGHRVCREPETKNLYVIGPKQLDHTGENRINYEVVYSKDFYSQYNPK